MKFSLYSLIIFSSIVLWSSCVEEGPLIILEESQQALQDTCFISSTPITAQPRNVLFEEFSGVRCSNCPAGNLETHNLKVTHGDRLVPVTVHSDFLALPYAGNPDFRNADANAIANTLGPVSSKPSCFVARKVIQGQRLVISLGTWSGLVNDALAVSTPVNIELEIVSFDVVERTFRYKTTLSYSAAAADHSLGFYLTESELISEQLDGSVKLPDYEHEFVLRKSITPIVGEPLTGCALDANTVIVKEFEIDLDDSDFDPGAEWNIEHMELVAFIRQADDVIINASSIEITQ